MGSRSIIYIHFISALTGRVNLHVSVQASASATSAPQIMFLMKSQENLLLSDYNNTCFGISVLVTTCDKEDVINLPVVIFRPFFVILWFSGEFEPYAQATVRPPMMLWALSICPSFFYKALLRAVVWLLCSLSCFGSSTGSSRLFIWVLSPVEVFKAPKDERCSEQAQSK